MGLLPHLLPDMSPSQTGGHATSSAALGGKIRDKPGLGPRRNAGGRSPGGEIGARFSCRRDPVKTFAIHAKDRLGKLELWSCRICSSPKPRCSRDICSACGCLRMRRTADDETPPEKFNLSAKAATCGHAFGLRYSSHPFRTSCEARLGQAIPLRTSRGCLRRNPEVRGRIRRLPGDAASRRIERNVAGPQRPTATRILTSRLAPIFSAHDTLFTSGSLGRYCTHDPLPS